MTIKIWGISDNRAGHLSQIQSILDTLPHDNKLFLLKNNVLGKIGFSLKPLGVNKKDFVTLTKALDQEIPTILIVIGRRNLSVALYIKRIAKLRNASIKLVFLMPPGTVKNKHIDLYFIHRYKIKNNINYPNNVIPIDFSPSKLVNSLDNTDDEDLVLKLKEKLQLNINHLLYKKPYIGVLIGGKANGVVWNTKVAKILCNSLNNLSISNKATLIVSTSRRTGNKISYYIQKNLLTGSIFWKYNNLTCYNPYIDIITKSDILVVTGESTSMISDCVTLNHKAKVLIFDNTEFKANRFKRFRDFLYTNNYAVPLKNGKLQFSMLRSQSKLGNTVYFVANTIKSML